MAVKKMSERREAWFRILVFFVSGIILAVWGYLIILLIIVNWFITIFSKERNKDIAEFCEYWNTETYRFIQYMTFVNNERPFPFTEIRRIGKFEK